MWKCIVLLLLCAHYASLQENGESSLYVLGIFGEGKSAQEKAFKQCINMANIADLTLEPRVIKPYRRDSYTIWNSLCRETEEMNIHPIVVFGPQDRISDSAVKDQCTQKHIPHIQATWQPIESDDPETEGEIEVEELFDKTISLNFFPPTDDVSLAYAHLLQYYGWENFAVLYEDDQGLMRVQQVLSSYSGMHPIVVRRLTPKGDNKHIFKDLAKHQESRVLLDCDVDNVMDYLKEATELNMLNDYQHYVITSLDTGTLADDLKLTRSNITWLSITNFDKLSDSQHFLTTRVGEWVSDSGKAMDPPKVTRMKLESLLMDDIANHIKNAITLIDPSRFQIEQPPEICNPTETWGLGREFLYNLIKNETIGVSGNISFDGRGRRKNYTLLVNEIHGGERNTIGEWTSATKGPIKITKLQTETVQQTSKHFVIISRLAKPYLSYANDTNEYEGFSKDLADHIFEVLRKSGYNYTHSFARNLEGKGYGQFNTATKKWDGLIGDLLSKTADLAIGDLTITEERKKVVDFSVPFMTLGISILYKKEHEIPPDTFSFLHPYSFEVWMHTATAYCVVSIILFICSRISPADWENPQPCDKDPEELENIWNFKNCTWLTMGSIMTQGCDILPKAIGTRWVCGMWWFFAMIVAQTYIAQLAASLTSASEDEPIQSVEDLAKQTKILYGAIAGGSTYQFFKNSKDKMYQRMFQTMETNPVVYVKSNDEGEQLVLRARNGFAFFMESSTIEYKLKRNCELKKVGGELDTKDYGVAMPSNSPFRSQINRAILHLQELTILDKIRKKWWEEMYGAQQCPEETEKGDVEGDLEMENLIGAFLVLIIGLVFCILISIGEFLFECHNIVIREQVTYKEAIRKELKASLDITKNEKPVLRNPSRAPSLAVSLKNDERLALRAANIADFMNFEKNG